MPTPWVETTRKTKALTLALVSLHLRSEEEFAGATYGALKTILGTTTHTALRRMVIDAQECGYVKVRFTKSGVGVVLLTRFALLQIDRLFKLTGDKHA